ncbi:hypothetical protein V6Z11_A07G262100, partial [Gossypium hirsutum]
ICSHRVHIASFHKTTSWDEGTDCCKWEGVVCDNKKGNVIGLDLCFPSWLNLTGNDFGNSEIPSAFETNWSNPLSLLDISWTRFSKGLSGTIGNLKHLKHLNLYRCDFMGSSVLGNLTKITLLDISGNIGVLLSSAFNLTSLTFMDFSGNFPQGTLPNNISGLSYLDLYANLLSGRVPGWLFSLPSLEYLDLSSNKLNGPIDTIPSSFFDFMNLTFLDLSSNNLSGNIKSCMHVKLRNLRSLDLLFNNLPSLTRCSNDVNSTLPMIIEFHFSSCNMHRFASFLNVSKHLQVLDLSNNQIQAEGWEDLVTLNLSMNFLSSVEQIPRKHLFVLDLRSNSLQGPLPTPPQELSYFLISNKELVGEISSKSCNLSFLHSVLDLSKNKLGGTIPDCFGTFSDQLSVIVLRTLSLSGNQLEGSIPQSLLQLFENLKSMEEIQIDKSGSKFQTFFTVIDFSSNHFKGSIPKKVGELNSLILLNFSHNSLASSIPPSLGKLATLESLDFSSNKIQGRTHFDAFSNDSFDGNSGLSGFPLSKKYGNDQEPESLPSTVADKFETTLIWKMAAMGYGSRVVLRLNLGYIVFTTERPVG